jgi:hypothetical protein
MPRLLALPPVTTRTAEHAEHTEDAHTEPAADSGLGVTTLILHGLPSRKTLVDILPILQSLGFGPESFDFVFMPRRLASRGNKVSESNFGYMFINFLSPALAAAFCRAVYHHPLGRNERACDKVWCGAAATQGRDANLALANTVHGSDLHKQYRLVRTGTEWQYVWQGGCKTVAL